MSFSGRFYPKQLTVDQTKQETFPLEQCGVKGLAQGPNSSADLTVARPGIEPPTSESRSLTTTIQAATPGVPLTDWAKITGAFKKGGALCCKHIYIILHHFILLW